MAEGGGEESRAESWAADPTHWSNPGYKAAREAKAAPKPTRSTPTRSKRGRVSINPHVDKRPSIVNQMKEHTSNITTQKSPSANQSSFYADMTPQQAQDQAFSWGNPPGIMSQIGNPHASNPNAIGHGWGPFSTYSDQHDSDRFKGKFFGILDTPNKPLSSDVNYAGKKGKGLRSPYASSWAEHVANSYNSAANVPGYYGTKMADLASRLGINPPAQKTGLAHNMKVAGMSIAAKTRNLLQGLKPEQLRQNLEIDNWANEMMGGDLGEMGVAGGKAGSHHF